VVLGRVHRDRDGLADSELEVQTAVDIRGYTDPIHDATRAAHLVLSPGLKIESVDVGYWFWGRPSLPFKRSGEGCVRRSGARTPRPGSGHDPGGLGCSIDREALANVRRGPPLAVRQKDDRLADGATWIRAST
jgi:hypothetical protein